MARSARRDNCKPSLRFVRLGSPLNAYTTMHQRTPVGYRLSESHHPDGCARAPLANVRLRADGFQYAILRLEMAPIAVYAFEYFDRASGQWKRAPDMATAEAIREMAGRVLANTCQEVAPAEIARSGIVRRVRSGSEFPWGYPKASW